MEKVSYSTSNQSPAYICWHPKCFSPVSVDNLPNHLKMHKDENTEANIEKFDDFIQNTKQKIASYRKEIEKNVVPKTDTSDIDIFEKKLLDLKQKIIESIENCFSRFIETNRKSFEKISSKMNELCEQNLYEMDQFETEFDNLSYTSDEIKKFFQKLEKIPHKITDFSTHLKEYSTLLKKSLLVFDADRLTGLVKEFQSCLEIKHDLQGIEVKPYSVTNFEPAHQFELKDYFANNSQKLLYFFKENTKEAYILDLEKLESGVTWKKLTLNIDFKIPRKHSSLITPMGSIFLMGGADPDYSTNKLNKTYLLDENSATLLRKSPFTFPRIAASAVYFQGHIFLVGGKTTKDGYTNKVEKYSVKFDKWVNSGSLNNNSYAPTLCNFNDQYIYKFGGLLKKGIPNEIIEKYSPVSDKWSIVPFKPSFVFEGEGTLPTMGLNGHAVQVSGHEILIFGGSTAEGKPADSVLMFMGEESENGKLNKWKPGRTKEKFRSFDMKFDFPGEKYGDTVVHKNQIISLRSLPKESMKKVIVFSSQWNIL